MKKLLNWIALSLGGLVLLAILAVGTVFVIVGRTLSETHKVADVDVPVPTSPDDITEGARRARTLGCSGGCHGKDSYGTIFFEVPDGSRVVAPDLHRKAATYSTAELERAIRHGIKPDGTTVLGAMPSEMFYHLSDRDLGRIIAYLRSRPPGTEIQPESRIGPMMRVMLLHFQSKGWNPFVAGAIDHDAPRLAHDPADPLTHGRYLATTTCTECHGNDLNGSADGSTPNLTIAAAYTLADFSNLLRTGEPIGDRQLELMTLVAQKRFAHFNDEEITALHACLQQRAGVAAASSL